MLSCREVESRIDSYLDGELEPESSSRLLQHLQECPRCGELLADRIREAELLLSSFPVPQLGQDFQQKVLERISAAGKKRGKHCQRLFGFKPLLAPALAGLLLVAAAGGFHFHQDRATNREAGPTPQTALGGAGLKAEKAGATGQGTSAGRSQATFKSTTNNGEGKAPVSESRQAGSTSAASGAAVRSTAATVSSTAHSRNSSQASPADSIGNLLRAGYTVFVPTCLPPGYTLKKLVISDCQATAESRVSSQEPLEMIFGSPDGNELHLTIRPAVCASPQQPAVMSAEAPGEEDNGLKGGDNSITWQAEKDGKHFTLTLSGPLPEQELQNIATSIR